MTFSDLLHALLDRVWARTRWHGFYLYEVREDHARVGANGAHRPEDDRLSLRRVGEEPAGLPDMVTAEKRYGAFGLFSKATVGDLVLVGFEGGSPARPYVAFRVPANPEHLLVDADSYVQIGTNDPERPDKRVYVGSNNRKKVARETDPVSCGVIQFVPGAGVVQIKHLTANGVLLDIGTLAASSLVFTPGVDGPNIGVQGKITGGSTLFRSE